MLNGLLLCLFEVSFPEHHCTVGASSRKPVSGVAKVSSIGTAFMSIDYIQVESSLQISNFNSGIVTARQQEPPARVEVDAVDDVGVRVIMLNQALRPHIKDFEFLVSTAGG